MGFINHQRALERVARNYRDAMIRYADPFHRDDRELQQYDLRRADAIVQTWAEVTDQPWRRAKDELHKAAFIAV